MPTWPRRINVAKAEALALEFVADPDHNATGAERAKHAARQVASLTHDCGNQVQVQVLDALRPLNAKNFAAATEQADAQIRHMPQFAAIARFLKEGAQSHAGQERASTAVQVARQRPPWLARCAGWILSIPMACGQGRFGAQNRVKSCATVPTALRHTT
jgi:hypothetical protein